MKYIFNSAVIFTFLTSSLGYSSEKLLDSGQIDEALNTKVQNIKNVCYGKTIAVDGSHESTMGALDSIRASLKKEGVLVYQESEIDLIKAEAFSDPSKSQSAVVSYANPKNKACAEAVGDVLKKWMKVERDGIRFETPTFSQETDLLNNEVRIFWPAEVACHNKAQHPYIDLECKRIRGKQVSQIPSAQKPKFSFVGKCGGIVTLKENFPFLDVTVIKGKSKAFPTDCSSELEIGLPDQYEVNQDASVSISERLVSGVLEKIPSSEKTGKSVLSRVQLLIPAVYGRSEAVSIKFEGIQRIFNWKMLEEAGLVNKEVFGDYSSFANIEDRVLVSREIKVNIDDLLQSFITVDGATVFDLSKLVQVPQTPEMIVVDGPNILNLDKNDQEIYTLQDKGLQEAQQIIINNSVKRGQQAILNKNASEKSIIKKFMNGNTLIFGTVLAKTAIGGLVGGGVYYSIKPFLK